jgi:hypothetical protein
MQSDHIRHIVVVLFVLVASSLVGCSQTHVQEPWVSGDQYNADRERSAERADELRHRIREIQQDR